MRYLIGLLAAAAVALGIFAASLIFGSNDEDRATGANASGGYAALLTGAFTLDDAKALDMDAALALAPEGWTATYGSSAFDETHGGTLIEDLRIASDRVDGLAIEIDALTVWGGDPAAFSARLRGEDLDSTRPLAARIDARKVRVTGLAALFTTLLDAVNEADLLETAQAGEDIDLAFSMDTYDVAVDRLVVDEVTLHPWVLERVSPERFPADVDDAFEEILYILQDYAAITRAYSVEGAAFENLSLEMIVEQVGEPARTAFTAASGGYEGIDRGDLAFAEVRDLVFEGDMLMPDFGALEDLDEDDPPPMKALKASGSTAVYAWRDIRAGVAFDHLARGVLPEPEVTDFISFGVGETRDSTYAIDGQTLYAVGETRIDLSGFHWLAPTRFGFAVENAVYDVGAIRDFIVGMIPEEEDTAEIEQIVSDVIEVLAKYDLDRPSLDLSMDWTWDAEAGPAAAALVYGFDGVSRTHIDVSGALPAYGSWSGLIGWDEDATDSEALQALFEADTNISAASLRIVDEGGFDKIFALIPEVAAVLPQDTPQMQVMAAYDAEALRTISVAAVQMAKGPAVAEAPRLAPLFDAMAAFIQDGGVFEIRMRPPEPLNAALSDALDEEDDPDAILDMLGFEVEHTPPAATP